MTPTDTVPFIRDDVRAYLDEAITTWRGLRDAGEARTEAYLSTRDCVCYVDAFQSVRTSLFGETLGSPK